MRIDLKILALAAILLTAQTGKTQQNCVYLASDIYSGSFGSLPTLMTPFLSGLYFSAQGAGTGTELWKIENGVTSLVADINPGFFGSMPNDLVVLGGNLYFTANNGINGKELCKYDGSTVTMVADVNPGITSSMPDNLTVVGSNIYFTADDGVNGVELWKFNGVTASLAANVAPGSASSNPSELTALGTKVCFSASDGTNGTEFWVFDGVSATLFNINAGSTSSTPSELTQLGTTVCFRATEATSGTELWVYDGSGVTMYSINPSGNGNPYELTVMGTELFFRGFDFTNGYEFWKFNGSAVSLIMDIRPGGPNSLPTNLTAVGTDLYFAATNGTSGIELWKYDGTTTAIAADINAGAGNSMPAAPTEKFAFIGSNLFFIANNGFTGDEVYMFDGTNAILGKDILPGLSSPMPSGLTAFGSTMYFMADNGVVGGELWAWNPNADLSTDITVTACGSYTSPGGTVYSTEGNYVFTDLLPSTQCPGCDSLVNVDLTITLTPSSSITVVECGSYVSPAGTLYNVAGNYLFTDIVPSISCPGIDSSITVDLTLIDNVSVSVVAFGFVLVAQQAGAAYQWLDCNNGFAQVPGATDQDFLATVDGNYACQISVGGCTDTSACFVIFGLGVNQTDLSETISVYPIPSTNQINISQPVAQLIQIQVTDNLGNVVFADTSQLLLTTIDISAFAKGVYFLRIGNENGQFVQRIVKE